MPRAGLRVTLPAGVWIGAVSTAHPEATFRVLSALETGGTGVGLVEVVAAEPSSVVAAVADSDDVVDLDVLGSTDERAVLRFETGQPLLLFSLAESGVPLEPPFEIRDGVATVSVTATRDRLSELADQLRAVGLSFDVEYVHDSLDEEPLLTPAQRELVTTAVELGYYDTPRECTLTGLADAAGLAKSTASETLHRAEGAIVKRFVAGLPGESGDELEGGWAGSGRPPDA